MTGIISSSHKDMNAEAHISEILDSEADDDFEEKSQERDSAQQQKSGDIWSSADFWNKPVVKKQEPKPTTKTTTVKPKEPD